MRGDFGGADARMRSGVERPAVWLAAILAGTLLFGCAAARSVQQTVGGWLGAGESETHANGQRPRAYYAATARTPLYREPKPSADRVGELALHEGVLRSRVENGFAYVTAVKGGRVGWVRQSDLIERLPGESAPRAKAAPAAAEPATAETDKAPAESGEAPAEAESRDAGPPPAEPGEKSVFDPY